MTMADLDRLRTTLAAQRTRATRRTRALFVEQQRSLGSSAPRASSTGRVDPKNQADRQTRDESEPCDCRESRAASRLGAAKDGAPPI